MPLPKSRTKLLKLFSKIKDESVKRIISEVINIENEYRSSPAVNFPRKKIDDVIDAEANYLEIERQKSLQKGKEK